MPSPTLTTVPTSARSTSTAWPASSRSRMVVISSAFKAMIALLANFGWCAARTPSGLDLYRFGPIPASRFRQLPSEAVELAAQAAVEELGLHLRHETGEHGRGD